MDDEIDIVITGHTNWAVNCVIDGKVVTGAASQGRLITDIDAKIDRATDDFVPARSRSTTRSSPRTWRRPPTHEPHRRVQRRSPRRSPRSSSANVDRRHGPRRPSRPAGESTLGRLIADAQLASSQAAGAGA